MTTLFSLASRARTGLLCAAGLAVVATTWAMVVDVTVPGRDGAGAEAAGSRPVVSVPPAPAFAPSGAQGESLSDASSATMPQVRVRDSATGQFLEAALQVQPLAARAVADRQGRVPLQGARLARLPRGAYQASLTMPGYQPLSARLDVGAGAALPVTFWLRRTTPSTAPERRALAAVECGTCAVVAGHVHDVETGKPLAGVQVTADRGGRATTGPDGGFELMLPAAPATARDAEALPETTGLTFQGQGFSHRITGVALYADSHDLVVDLRRGVTRTEDLSHVRMSDARTMRADQVMPTVQGAIEEERIRADREKALDPTEPASVALAQVLQAQVATIPVPNSIRVGTGCTGRSCTGVSVYAMEDYVGRGLDDEWIASWDADSLAAGAIAYRSYGAYYVDHPVNAQYDICSSTSCQVFRSASATSTLAAAAATRGVLLTRDGQTAAFAEYSAENNAWDDPGDGLSCSNADLSCGDGNNGSPKANWPCLSDSVGRGRGCFGHGRGMSQWGTQRWAANNGRDWKWIANHYFNGNGHPDGMRNAFLANVGGSTGTTTLLDTFESGLGRFGTSPTYSGSTRGIAATSTSARNCTTRHGGACSLGLRLEDDAASSEAWAVRLLSGVGTPAANVPLGRAGRIGFWVWSGGSGMSVGVGIDDSDGTERSVTRAIAANRWTWVEWSLSDAAQWNAWSGGNGAITAASVTLDAIWFHRAQTSYAVNLYIDDVQYRK